MTKLLENKVAVVTGSTRGLGLAIAQAYLAEGASVVVSGRNQASVDAAVAGLAAPGRTAGLACDVGDLKQVQALGAFALATFGRIDIWVNNAGFSAPYGPTVDIPPTYVQQVFGANILGVYNGSLVALRAMQPNHRGKLINLLGRGDDKPVKFQNAYSSSKTWVRAFTTALAQEQAGSGIEVIAYNPGLVDTDMLRQVDAVRGFEERVKPLETVMRLWANPPRVPAQKAVWLASAATDGKPGLVFSLLSPPRLLAGALREVVRRLLRRPAPDMSITIHTVP